MIPQDPVRFLRTEATMAFPGGRLLAVREGTPGRTMFVLGPDGWSPLAGNPPSGAQPLSRQEADDWCEHSGCDRTRLDAVSLGPE